MGRQDRKSNKQSKDKARLQKQLDQLTAEARQNDEQYGKLRRRNQQLILQLTNQKEQLDILNAKMSDEMQDQDEDALYEDKIANEGNIQGLTHRQEDKNTMQDDLINNEIDAMCNRIIENYIEPLNNQNLSFQVEHQGNRAVFELKNENHSFRNIKPVIAQYFALPQEEIFFKNERDEVLLSNLKVLPTLFPLINSKIRNTTPVLKIALKCNMSTLDYIIGDEHLKQAMQQEQEDQEQIHQNNLHQSRQRDQAKQRDQEVKNMRDRIQKKQQCIKISLGLTQTAIFLLFIIFQIILVVRQRNVVTSYWSQYSSVNQMMGSYDKQVQFNNQTHMLDYIKNVIGGNIQKQTGSFDMFWDSNYLLPFVQFQQIRGQSRSCDFSGRDGFTELYGNQSCVTTYASGDYDTNKFQGINYVEENKVVSARGQIYTFQRIGHFKNVQVRDDNSNFQWSQAIDQNIIQPNWLDAQSLVFIITLNMYNQNTNLLQAFKLIFQFQANGIITLEQDSILINMKLYSSNFLIALSALIYIIGFILLAISILDVRRQRKQRQQEQLLEELGDGNNAQEEIKEDESQESGNQNNGNDRTQAEDSKDKSRKQKKILEKANKPKKHKTCRQKLEICSLKGISTFEIINILMIIFTYLNLGMKYLYDRIINQAAQDSKFDRFIDFSLHYFFYEALFIFDSIIIFMMALSIIKYTFFWIPSLSLLTKSLQNYLNSTIKKIVQFVFILSFAIAAYCHFFYGYVTYGFYDYSFALIRANLLFLQGNLFNRNKIYLADETIEYVYERQGWFATIFSIGIIHFFGRYVILNIIIAFMKKDIQDTKLQIIKSQALEKIKAENSAKIAMKENIRQNKIIKRQNVNY
eukprot:403342941